MQIGVIEVHNNLRLILLLLLISVLLLGCHPGIKGGRLFYSYGKPWTTDLNTVYTVDASFSKIYHASNCETYEAEEGETFIIVQCKARFVQGWTFSYESYLSGYGATAPHSDLFLFDQANSPDSDGYDTYNLLFIIEDGTYSDKLEDYWIRIQIGKSDAVQRVQDFALQPPVK